jgi:hypothetical protein
LSLFLSGIFALFRPEEGRFERRLYIYRTVRGGYAGNGIGENTGTLDISETKHTHIWNW